MAKGFDADMTGQVVGRHPGQTNTGINMLAPTLVASTAAIIGTSYKAKGQRRWAHENLS